MFGYIGGSVFDEIWCIWLDVDYNGSFIFNEIIFDVEVLNMLCDGFMIIFLGVNLGIICMCVMMCFSFIVEVCFFLMGFGEVEDYCVNILLLSVCFVFEGFEFILLSFIEVDIVWDFVM